MASATGDAVRTLVEEGPAAIQQLIDWGAEFDKEGQRLSFTREAAHSRNRILHSHGDSTGREIARTLYNKAASLTNVRFESYSAVSDLLTAANGSVQGAVMFEERLATFHHVRARTVLLATGGLGRVYKETTNPGVATGDGVAMAWRAGADISNIEFVQFHPTALHVEGAPRFLLSEALRGEGAVLRNTAGDAFMHRYHEMADLAPRDVVSRAIVSEMKRTDAPHVFLDITAKPANFIRTRFPRIYETCRAYGVDITTTPAPVHPAAHYSMGGVTTDLDGRTDIAGLFAAGEVACTGVHGANRLASNSLLEALVYGARAARVMRSENTRAVSVNPLPRIHVPAIQEQELRTLAWELCGIVRERAGLTQAIRLLSEADSPPMTTPTLAALESRNIHQVAQLIAEGALWREESRGAHFRTDFPDKSAAFATESHTTRTAAAVRS